MKFEGVYTPLVTPFHKDFTLNKQAMQASIDLLIDAGIDRLIVAGTEGEYYAMSMKERVYLMRVAKEMIAGRVPMIIGTSAIRTEECIEYARQAKLHAADAVLVTAPPVALPTGPEIAAHVLAIERATKLPLILHNDPQRLSVNLDESCLAQIVASNPPSALIYNSGNPEHLHMLARAPSKKFKRVRIASAGQVDLRMRAQLGLRGFQFCTRGPYRALSGLRDRRRFCQRSGDHVSHAAFDAGF